MDQLLFLLRANFDVEGSSVWVEAQLGSPLRIIGAHFPLSQLRALLLKILQIAECPILLLPVVFDPSLSISEFKQLLKLYHDFSLVACSYLLPFRIFDLIGTLHFFQVKGCVLHFFDARQLPFQLCNVLLAADLLAARIRLSQVTVQLNVLQVVARSRQLFINRLLRQGDITGVHFRLQVHLLLQRQGRLHVLLRGDLAP